MGGFLLYRLSCLPFILVLNMVLPLTASASQPDDSGACQNAQLIADENDRLFSHTGTNSRCDRDLDRGWYRFSLNGQPAEIPTSCVKNNHCGTQLPLHLDLGGNDLPGINQTLKGHVCTSFNILGYWDCCVLRMTTYIRNCSGYYVYHLEPTDRCPVAYCLQVESQRPSSHVTAKTGESVGPGQQQSNEDEQSTTTTLPSSATVSSFGSTDSQIETSTSPSTDPPAPEPLAGSSDISIPSTTPSSNSVTPSSLHAATVNLSEISMINSSPEQSSTFEITTEIETSGSTEASSKEVATNTSLTPRQTTDISDNTSARTVSSIGTNESSSVTNDSTTSVLSNVNETSSTLTTMVSQTQTASLSSPMLAASTDSADRGSSAFVTQSTVSLTGETLDRNRTCLNGTDSFLCGNNTCFRGSSQLIMLCQVNSIWQCVQACDVYPDCDNGEDEDQALCGESNQQCTEGTQTCPNKEGCFADCNDPVVSHNYPIRFTINGTAYRDSQERMDHLPPTADVKRAVFESINNITGTRNWDSNSITFQNLSIVDRENFVIDALGIFNISQKGISLSELGGLFQNDTFLDMIARRLFGDSTLVISTSARFVNDTERISVLPSTSTTISEASTHYATSVRNDGGTTQTSETISFTSKGMTSTELVEQNENNTTIATNYSGITEDSSEFNMTNVHSTTADSENLASKTTISITVSASMNNTLSTTTPGSVISSSPSSSTSSLESSTTPRAAVSTNNTTTSLQYPSTYTSEMQTTSSPITTVQANNILTVDTLTSTISASSKVSTDTISTEINNQTVSDGSSSTQVATSAVIGTTNVTDEPQSTEQNDQSTAEVSERQDRMTESATLSSTMSAISTQSSSSHVSTAPASSLSSAVSSLPYTNTSTLQTALQTNQSDTASSPRALPTATMSNIDRTTSTESLLSVALTSTGLSRSSASTVVLPITTQGQLTTKSISSSTSHSGMSTASSLASEETASTESSSPQDNEGFESTSQTHGQTSTIVQLSTSQTHGQTSTIVQLPTTNLRSSSSMFTSGGFTPLSTSSSSTEGDSQTSSDSIPSTDSLNIATTEKVKLSIRTTEQVTSISNDTTEALNTIKTPVDDEEKGDKENIIVEFFNKNTGLFIFIIIAGAAMLGICIFGIAGTIYQRRMRTWTPKINYKDVYPDMEKSMMHFGQERSGIESPIPDVDILQEEQTGEDRSLSKASTLVCGPTPDRIQGTSTRSNDTPVTGASSAVSLNGHANEAYQSDESLDLDGVTPFDELDEQYPRNKFPWIDNAEDTKV